MEGGHFYVLSLQGVCYELLHTMSADRYGHRAYRPHRSYRTSRPRRSDGRNRGDPRDPRALTDFPAPRGPRERPGFPVLRALPEPAVLRGQQALRGPRARPGRRDPQAPRARQELLGRRALRGRPGAWAQTPMSCLCRRMRRRAETEVRRHRSKPSSRRWRPLRPTA